MAKQKSIQQIWVARDSGFVAPEGSITSLSQASSQTYLRIKEKALEIEDLYRRSNIPLAPISDLAQLIADAKTLSDSWLTGRADSYPATLVFRAALLDRIADAVLPLSTVPDRIGFLAELLSGTLDLLDRKRSRAKDVLWELELWATLRRRSFDAILEEPPDIVVKFAQSKIGIACKKVYSEKHVQNVLSEAVAQIESNFDFGIVAVNLDDLVPANGILKASTQEAMAQRLRDLNARFLTAHERHFRKYLAAGRVISALVSTGVLADVSRARTRFNNARQLTVWTIPGLPFEKDRQLKKFYEILTR